MATMTREKNALLDRVMQLAGGVLHEMVNTPEGAEIVVKQLRKLGWVCTPPEQRKGRN